MPIGKPARTDGFTYVGLLIAIVLFGLASVGAARILASTERVERERELIFIGHQFRDAIRSYYLTGPGVRRYPQKLEDLLLDPRLPGVRRHLRRLFVDPVTGKSEWGVVMAPEGGIMGIHSLSEMEPLKQANFDPADADFVLPPTQVGLDKPQRSYRDWRFVYRPETSGGAPYSVRGG